MTTKIFNGDSISPIKRIKLNNDPPLSTKESDTKDHSKHIKLEPTPTSNGNTESVSSDGSKDILLKVYPVYNVSDKANESATNTNHKSVQFYVTNLSKLCSRDDNNLQVKVNNDGCRNSKFHHESISQMRPSEALFVRCLLPHCKRLAPLWFKGVSSMRDKSREEHRRISASTTCQNQNDWERISNLINDMTAASETETVVNLLKKLYKELPADTVLWFIKCWLKFPETIKNEDKCALSRGDARGRMRRIDGGKGSDKVWRLDTIVGMMFHGMPMSSTDTNIMVHTCDQELCIRPQHLRFKASSVALVVVLKALQQTGYSIIPPPDETYSNVDSRSSPSDEFVDVSGPFKIEQLQQYRLEELRPCEQSMGKLNSNSTDINLLDTYPLLKNYYPTYTDDLKQNLLESKSIRNTCCNIIQPISGVKRPAQTTSNSTGSPPNISVDGNSHQCHSPPTLSGVKLQNIDIAPTPRKADLLPTYRLNSFKKTEDSPSSSIFSNGKDRESYGQAPDLLAEEPIELKQTLSNENMRTISRLTNESPIIGLSSNSGKNTPRQPAKKRLEARTPTFLSDDQLDTFSSMSSPIDNKLNPSSNSVSAFRVVQKKNLINSDIKQELKSCEEPIEMELDTIFPSNINDTKDDEYQYANCHPDGILLSEATTNERKEPGNGKNSEYGMPRGSEIYKKISDIDPLTTPSPLDYLLMAISGQTPGFSTPGDQMPILGTTTSDPNPLIGSPMFCGRKTPMNSNFPDNCFNNASRFSLSASSTVSCRFTPEQASVMLNALRNSPLGNSNPEIIDMLYNMMQQYGINHPCNGDGANCEHTYRPDSVVLRKQIYHQLSKASPQLEGSSFTPISNEISNEDSMTVRSSPCQGQQPHHKPPFNPYSNARNTIHTTEH